MLTDEDLGALRRAATLTHVLPLRTTVRHEGHTVLEVARPPHRPLPGARWLPPCGFRAAVGNAWRAHRSGRRVLLDGLPSGSAPSVEVAAPPGGATRPGDIHQVPIGELLVHVFASSAHAELVREVGHDLRLGAHVDELTGVTLLHLASRDAADADHALDLVETALARVTAEHVLAALAARP